MSDFAYYEQSAELGEPVELYEFTLGATISRYVACESSLTVDGHTWLPLQLARTAQASDLQENIRTTVEITMYAHHPLCLRYIGTHSGERMKVRIYKRHRAATGAGQRVVIWNGYVTSARFVENGTKCILTTVPKEAGMASTMLRYKYHSLCNHFLYEDGCGLDPEDFKHVGTVLNVSDNRRVLDVMALPSSYAAAGTVKFGSEWRTVTHQDGQNITLAMPFAHDPLHSEVTVYRGCNRHINTCKNTFDNVVNFGGFPAVPQINPHKDGVR